MLLSLVLSVTPTVPTRLNGFYGRQVQGWLLSQVDRHAPGVAQALHGYSGTKPYTVSSLVVPDAGRRGEAGEVRLMPRDECLLRITALAEPLSDLLLEKVIPNLPDRLRLKWTDFRVLGVVEENGWAGRSTFEKIQEQAAGQHGGPSVRLEFASPTAFRMGQVDLALPTPDHVWRSLYWRWNSFAPQALQIDARWPDFAAACIVTSDFHLRSMKVTFKQGDKGAATGATGHATYRLLDEKHCAGFAPYRAGAENVLRALAAFALYSGVGHHTTTGLGQARWLPPG